MEWIKQSSREPTHRDMPFVTYLRVINFHGEDLEYEEYDFWDDTDWFFELTEEERQEWKYWCPLTKPNKE